MRSGCFLSRDDGYAHIFMQIFGVAGKETSLRSSEGFILLEDLDGMVLIAS